MPLVNNADSCDTYLDVAQRLLLHLPATGTASCRSLAGTLGVPEAHVEELIQELLLHAFPLVNNDHGLGFTTFDFSPLSPDQIASQLDSSVDIARIECFATLASTSDYLLSSVRSGQHMKSGTVCFAELQTAGRGRCGKHWISPAGKNLYLSAYWHLPPRPEGVSGLSLALGVAVAEVLAHAGLDDVKLKWPNDILWHGQKLGGILVESSIKANSFMHVVVGLGLNVKFISHPESGIDQPWTELESVLGREVDRCQLAAQLLTAISNALMAYWQRGLTPFRAQWEARNALAGKSISATSTERKLFGVACGLDDTGALLLDTGDAVIRLFTEEVSIRALDNAGTSSS